MATGNYRSAEFMADEENWDGSDPFWTGGLAVTHADVLALGAACLAAHEEYAPELVEEIRGMADATGLGVNELVIMNGFTDFVDLMANPAMVKQAGQLSGLLGDGDGGGDARPRGGGSAGERVMRAPMVTDVAATFTITKRKNIHHESSCIRARSMAPYPTPRTWGKTRLTAPNRNPPRAAFRYSGNLRASKRSSAL